MNTAIKKIKQYFQRTYKNKMYAMVLILAGIFSMKIADDSTFLIFALILGVPLFLTGKELMEEDWIW